MTCIDARPSEVGAFPIDTLCVVILINVIFCVKIDETGRYAFLEGMDDNGDGEASK